MARLQRVGAGGGEVGNAVGEVANRAVDLNVAKLTESIGQYQQGVTSAILIEKHAITNEYYRFMPFVCAMPKYFARLSDGLCLRCVSRPCHGAGLSGIQ